MSNTLSQKYVTVKRADLQVALFQAQADAIEAAYQAAGVIGHISGGVEFGGKVKYIWRDTELGADCCIELPLPVQPAAA